MTTVVRKELPLELLREIVTLVATNHGAHIFHKTLLKLCLVSKTFYNIAISFLYNEIINPKRIMIQIIPRLPNLRELSLFQAYDAAAEQVEVLGRYLLNDLCPVLSRVRSWVFRLPSKEFQHLLPGFLARHQDTLESLLVLGTVGPVDFPRTSFKGYCFPKLKRLELCCSSAYSLFHGFFPNLKEITWDFAHEVLEHEDAIHLASLVIDWVVKGQKDAKSLKSLSLIMKIDTVHFIDEISSAFPLLDSLSVDCDPPPLIGTLQMEACYRVGNLLARMPELRSFLWGDTNYQHALALYETARLIQHYGEKCPTLTECYIGASGCWTRVTGSAWVPDQPADLYKLFRDKTYPALDVLLCHLENLSSGSPAILRCIKRYRGAEAYDSDVTADLMVVIAHLGACDHVCGHDYRRMKQGSAYEERIQSILTR
ncbi:hypothetical protein VNI00_006046 [Paramarasmius palmivorus]|uniref:F-box domain-containing protein n=1 Tax=Paramarasmius palmivorus TaxID=297713 RepID=A0AAW0DAH8_9AGAR